MASVTEKHKEFVLLKDIKNQLFMLVLADGIKTKEGYEQVEKFRNEKEAIKGLIEFSTGTRKAEGIKPRLTLKDALRK